MDTQTEVMIGFLVLSMVLFLAGIFVAVYRHEQRIDAKDKKPVHGSI